MISNRRAHKRYKKAIFFRIVTPEPRELTSIDISLGGLLFESGTFCNVNQMLSLEIIIPNRKSIPCEARIAWVYPVQSQKLRSSGRGLNGVNPGKKTAPIYKVGLQFLNLSSRDQEKLKNFIY